MHVDEWESFDILKGKNMIIIYDIIKLQHFTPKYMVEIKLNHSINKEP